MKALGQRWFLYLLTVLTTAGFAQEWTRFRGPNGSGISAAKGIPTKLDEGALNWKATLPGSGHSSPVLWGEKLFVTSTGDKAGGISVLCLNATDGKLEWKKDFSHSPFQKHALNSFASSTPAVDAGRVYVLWNEPEHYFLTTLDHQGKQLWQRDLGPFVSQHGSGVSPMLCDGKVIVANFQDDPARTEGPSPGPSAGKSSIMALDAANGKTLWEIPRKTVVVAYSTPCVYQPPGAAPVLVCNSQSHGFTALDPQTGKIAWEYPDAFNKRTVSSPVIAGDIILGSCGSGGGGNVLAAIHAPKSGSKDKPTLAYEIKKAAAYVPTSVYKDGLIWMWSDAGILTCLDAKSGEIKYQERVGGNFFGSPVWNEGRLFCVSKTGELVVVEASDKFNVLNRYDLHETCESTPAIAAGKLFVRTEKAVWAFGAAEKKLASP
jgi:outer membrane protein assembly factor BamB